MTPEMQKKRDELAEDYALWLGWSARLPEVLGRTTKNITRISYDDGFNAAHDLMQEKVKPLIKAAKWFAHNPPTHFDDCQSLYFDEKCNCGAESSHNDLVAALKGWES